MKRQARRKSSTFRRRAAPGTSPGTLNVDPSSPAPVINVISYGPDSFDERRVDSIAALKNSLGKHAVTWINVDGLGDAEILRKLGEAFCIHRLALEDVVNVHQRSKIEHYDEHLFLVARMPYREETLHSEQISLFVGENYVLTFQERAGDCFDGVRDRIRQRRGKIRDSRSDYLAYACLDAIIDSYFPLVEHYTDAIDKLEDSFLRGRTPHVIAQVHGLKGALLQLRRATWQLRDVTSELLRGASPRIAAESALYFRDCYDHTLQIMEWIDSYHEVAGDLMHLELAIANHRMNEVMKVLTVVATIFIPLTFIAGVYGMNFNPEVSRWNMPELNWPHGYPLALGVMGAVSAGMLLYFRHKGWWGPPRKVIPDDFKPRE